LTLANLAPGFYDVVLTVSDNHGETGADSRTLCVIRTSDVNEDGQIGLAEAINALQVVSGARPPG